MDDILSKLNAAILSEHAPHGTLKDILGPDYDRDNTQMVELQAETPTVDRMLNSFNKQWEATAAACISRAQELEGAAMDLRERADRLRSAKELTAEVKGAVIFEINARNRAMSLALVNPKEG